MRRGGTHSDVVVEAFREWARAPVTEQTVSIKPWTLGRAGRWAGCQSVKLRSFGAIKRRNGEDESLTHIAGTRLGRDMLQPSHAGRMPRGSNSGEHARSGAWSGKGFVDFLEAPEALGGAMQTGAFRCHGVSDVDVAEHRRRRQ